MKTLATSSRLTLVLGMLIACSGCAGMVTDKSVPAPTAAVVDVQPRVQSLRPGEGITRYPVKMRQLRTLAVAPTVVR